MTGEDSPDVSCEIAAVQCIQLTTLVAKFLGKQT